MFYQKTSAEVILKDPLILSSSRQLSKKLMQGKTLGSLSLLTHSPLFPPPFCLRFLIHPTACILCIPKYLKNPLLSQIPHFLFLFLKHWLWQSSPANTHCFSDMSAAALNRVIARTMQSTKPLLSAAWALSDICHFRFTRALCQPYTDAAFSSNDVEKNAPPRHREPSRNLENTNQMLGDTTRRNFQFKQETSSGGCGGSTQIWVCTTWASHNLRLLRTSL